MPLILSLATKAYRHVFAKLKVKDVPRKFRPYQQIPGNNNQRSMRSYTRNTNKYKKTVSTFYKISFLFKSQDITDFIL